MQKKLYTQVVDIATFVGYLSWFAPIPTWVTYLAGAITLIPWLIDGIPRWKESIKAAWEWLRERRP